MHLPDPTRVGQLPEPSRASADIATALDPSAIVDQLAEAGTDMVVAFAKCQYGNFYYPTEHGHMHSGLSGRDFLGEMVEASRAAGIGLLAYYSNRWDVEAARAHPEWMSPNAEGELSYERWPDLCLSSPYGDLVQTQLAELVGKYDIDGVWFDIVHGDVCYSDFCRNAFGGNLPTDRRDSSWAEMIAFRREVTTRHIERSRATLEKTRPGLALVVNHYGSIYCEPSNGLGADHLLLSDCLSMEGYAEWHGLVFPGYVGAYQRGLAPGRPAEVLVSRFVNTWDFTLKPQPQFAFEGFTAAIQGAAVTIDDEPYASGQLEREVYRRATSMFAQIEARGPWLDLEADDFVGIFHSEVARMADEILSRPVDYSGEQFPPSDPNPGESDLLASTMGAYQAMLESHLPVGVAAVGAEAGRLEEFQVVLVPGTSALDPTEVEALSNFVSNGGGLVITGATGTHDHRGQRMSDPALTELIGARVGTPSAHAFSYLSGASRELESVLGPQFVPHYGATWELTDLAEDVEVLAERRPPVIAEGPENYYHNNKPAPGIGAEGPAVIRRPYGKGRVVYFAGRPDANFARFGMGVYRDLLAWSARWAGAEYWLDVEAAPWTQVRVGRAGGGAVVHLVSGVPKQALRIGNIRTTDVVEHIPRLSARLRSRRPLSRATRVPDGRPLAIESAETTWAVDLDDVGVWDTIVMEFAENA